MALNEVKFPVQQSDLNMEQKVNELNGDVGLPENNREKRKGKRQRSRYEEEILCGVGPCRPAWMQFFARRECYLLVYCLLGLIQGMYYTYFLAVLSTIEKRFGIASSKTGILMSGNEVSQILFSLFLAYYGGRGNRPKWMAGGMLVTAVAMFVITLPHFINGPGTDAVEAMTLAGAVNETDGAFADVSQITQNSLCGQSEEESKESCEMRKGDSSSSIFIFIALLVQGVGSTCYYSLGLPYLDDNAEAKEAPAFLGISSGIRLFGPFLGFMLGYACLKIFVVPGGAPNMDPSDPRWIGAWWLGFIIIGILLMFGSLLMLFFPFRLPKKNERKKLKDLRRQDVQMEPLEQPHMKGELPRLKDMPASIWRLLKNPIVTAYMINAILSIFGFMGFYTFMAKYVEAQFRTSAAMSSMFTGVSGVAVQMVGYVGTGFIIMKFKPKPRKVAAYNVFINVVQTAGFIAVMFISCPKLNLQGTIDSQGLVDLNNPYNQDCNCSTYYYNPVCHVDTEVTYYSPCHACCTEVVHNNNSETEDLDNDKSKTSFLQEMMGDKGNKTDKYEGCSCLISGLDSSGQCQKTPNFKNETVLSQFSEVIAGFCPIFCNQVLWYMIILGISKAVSSTGRVGGLLLLLRCIDAKDKSMVMGMFTFVVSLFALIPCPILYGAVIDSTCLVWKEKCGQRANCAYYDQEKFRYYLHGMSAVFVALATICEYIVYTQARNLKLYEEQEQKQKETEMEDVGVENKGMEKL